jgi:hypothetical protein
VDKVFGKWQDSFDVFLDGKLKQKEDVLAVLWSLSTTK